MFHKHISDETNSTKREQESKRGNMRNLICHWEFQKTFLSNTKSSGDLYENTDIN